MEKEEIEVLIKLLGNSAECLSAVLPKKGSVLDPNRVELWDKDDYFRYGMQIAFEIAQGSLWDALDKEPDALDTLNELIKDLSDNKDFYLKDRQRKL